MLTFANAFVLRLHSSFTLKQGVLRDGSAFAWRGSERRPASDTTLPMPPLFRP